MSPTKPWFNVSLADRREKDSLSESVDIHATGKIWTTSREYKYGEDLEVSTQLWNANSSDRNQSWDTKNHIEKALSRWHIAIFFIHIIHQRIISLY